MEQGSLILALDIEGRGPSMSRNGIVSIGACVGRASGGAIVEKRRWDLLPYPGQVMDQKCVTEFWSKQGNLLELLQKDAQDPSVAMASFRQFVDSLGPNVYIVCDAPAYDFGFINYYLDRQGLPLLQFDAQGQFRPLHDADSYARGACGYGWQRVWISNQDAVDQLYADTMIPVLDGESHLRAHMPEDDAEKIFFAHFWIVNKNSTK